MNVPASLSSLEKNERAVEARNQEFVSVVIPCYNEERFILKALDQLAEQYDPNAYEIIVVDGLSTDGTRNQIEQFKSSHPELEVKLLDNPRRNIPAALNIGIAAARGDIIARMDAHAVPSTGYIRGCVEALRDTDAGVIGMPCRVRPGSDTLMAQAIAGAVSHPFGIGDAKYRLGRGGSAQEAVDTVAFGCFRKSVWSDLQGFNEELLTNEDYEFNYRVRQAGQAVILDKRGYCDYFARTTLRALAEQYRRYGWWKADMVSRQPRSIRARHLVAPLFVISLIILSLAGFFVPRAWWLLLIELGLYLILSLVAAADIARKTKSSLGVVPLLPIVFTTIHLSWGTSFLLRLLNRAK